MPNSLPWWHHGVCCLAMMTDRAWVQSPHILSWTLRLEIGRVVAGRTSGVKTRWDAWLGLLSLSSVWLLQAS